MYTVSKEFHFEAAHKLSLPYESHCKRDHGHSYRVELTLGAHELDENSMVVDFNEMREFGGYIDKHLDHQNLNQVLGCQTTAENIARHLYMIAWKLWSHLSITVRVSETARTWASYSEG